MSEFRCRSLGLAAFLKHIGLHHLSTEKVGHKSVAFVFDDPLQECDRIERDYFGGAGCEDAQRFCQSYSDVMVTIRFAQRDGTWKNKD